MTYAPTVPLWMCQPKELPHPCESAGGSMYFSGYQVAEEVYGVCANERNSGLAAFAYLWRRFGPPWFGSDPNKELVCYYLGTPHPEVFLRLSLKGSRLKYGVGYLITEDVVKILHTPEREWETQFESWWCAEKTTPDEQAVLQTHNKDDENDPDEALRAVADRFWHDRMEDAVCREAETVIGVHPRRQARDWDHTHPLLEEPIKAALVELLRPVFIRDVACNILGHVSDSDLDERDNADESIYAGYGIPQEAMDAQLKDGD